tara:strand:+ start:346 stop:477 length:132 start_codon:yes stop_codon:yes gene_type:complete
LIVSEIGKLKPLLKRRDKRHCGAIGQEAVVGNHVVGYRHLFFV